MKQILRIYFYVHEINFVYLKSVSFVGILHSFYSTNQRTFSYSGKEKLHKLFAQKLLQFQVFSITFLFISILSLTHCYVVVLYSTTVLLSTIYCCIYCTMQSVANIDRCKVLLVKFRSLSENAIILYVSWQDTCVDHNGRKYFRRRKAIVRSILKHRKETYFKSKHPTPACF